MVVLQLVSIAAFQDGKMKMLSHVFDWSLGGRDFDKVLFSYFAVKFREQYSIDVYSNARACIRLRSPCEKLKVLSANSDAPLNIECLMDEKDVKGLIKMEEFGNLASGLLERICVPCNKALADAGLSVEKIHSVELVGSGSRIPAITRLLTSLFKREAGRTLNASECVARGCALQCAMLSPALHFKEYKVQDSMPFFNWNFIIRGRLVLSMYPFILVRHELKLEFNSTCMELSVSNQLDNLMSLVDRESWIIQLQQLIIVQIPKQWMLNTFLGQPIITETQSIDMKLVVREKITLTSFMY
ncbi:Heat shock 70 kDa protein [Arachis hypogaea]|nr:Heat shock 70 kDa protein [Arachis hypogaea]